VNAATEHAEALAWVRERMAHFEGRPHNVAGLRLAEDVLTRHAPDDKWACGGCSWPQTGHFRAWPCPDVSAPLAFVKAVRG